MSNAGSAGVASTKYTADAVSASNITAFGESLVAQLQPLHLAHFPYAINSDLFTTTTTGSGSVSYANGFAQAHSGAASSSSAQIASNNIVEYHAGIGASARFACIFDTPASGNTQIIGMGDDNDGYFFGYNGTSFGILRRYGGADNWIPQSSWSEDTFDGTGPSGLTLDPSKGNVYQVKYQWLGFGAQRFYIENQNTGAFQLVHVIKYANQNTATSTQNPSYPFIFESKNTTNTTDIVLKNSSQSMFIESAAKYNKWVRNAIDNTKSISTETNILTIRNKSTFHSITNKVSISPDMMTLASDGTKNVVIKIYLNATLGGTPSYTDINTNNSVVDYDTAGTTITGGKLLGVFYMAKNDALYIPLSEYEYIMRPGSTLTIGAYSAATSAVSSSIAWKERFA